MKKQSKHHIHSLTVRITAIAIIPLCILACILTIIGIGSIRSGIQDEVESTLQASTMGVQGMLDALNDSPLTLDGEKLYKGEIGCVAGVRFVESTEAKIWKGTTDGGKDGRAVYGTIVLGANAYVTTEIEGNNLRTIIKQLGSAGTADPLDQRSTIGWKALLTTKILVDEYMVRVETCSSFHSDAN